MFNPILKNCLPQLPDGYRWKFDVYSSYEDILRLQKRVFFNMAWETVDSEMIDKESDDSEVVDCANHMHNRNFGNTGHRQFYGTSV